ncbi:MAG: glycosyltransferase family A protein [Vicinamibacterales bacterium]
MTAERRYRVAVFARNEERGIAACLRALLDACPDGCDLVVHVMVNGCTDRTFDIASELARSHDEIRVVQLPFGDKAHAWNSYVRDFADDSPVHFFTDGDVTCSPRSLELMQSALTSDAGAMAIAGVPLSGRNHERYLRYIEQWHWLFGNLYAVKSAQLTKIRAANAYLPVGLCGTDHFISKLAAAETIRPTRLAWTQNIHRPDAGFTFRPLQPYRWADCRIYANRQITYALRQLQIPEMDQLDLADLPATVDDVNRRILARLEAAGRRLMAQPRLHAVRRRLRRMYPSSDSSWFETRLQRASRAPSDSAGRTHAR